MLSASEPSGYRRALSRIIAHHARGIADVAQLASQSGRFEVAKEMDEISHRLAQLAAQVEGE
jgi:hypothetical protein